jgi:hypothetical protein
MDEGLNKMQYAHNRILFSLKEEGSPVIYDNMVEPAG